MTLIWERPMCRHGCADALWFLAWAVASSLWCLTSAAQIGTTFDEPIYLDRGLQGWRHFSHWGLLQLGTMPLPIDVQTLPLYVWESVRGVPIDTHTELDSVLVYMRAGNLVFWWLLLWYARLTGRLLAGPWGGRLAVAMLACEPNMLAHAALATTDISVSACMLALLYHFRVGRDGPWRRRVALPALWFALAILAKASAVVYGPICLCLVELERLVRSGSFKSQAATFWQCLGNVWKQLRPLRSDLVAIAIGGFVGATLYCGSDFRTQPAFVAWAHGLPEGPVATSMVWLSEHLCIFSNAAEGIVRQVKHNVRGHGTFLLGEGHPRAVWYYFPVLLTIKLSLPILLAPLLVLAIRTRALANWACVVALGLLLFSITFRVQIGIRLVLPLVTIAIVGLAAAVVEALQSVRQPALRPILAAAVACALAWTTLVSVRVWPHGLCYVNELWGGTEQGYLIVSDSNYDWGQGLPELLAWQKQHGDDIDVWYFGSAFVSQPPSLHDLPLHALKVDRPEDVLVHLQSRYLAVGLTMLYGQATTEASHFRAVEFLRAFKPVARTTTFLIFERQTLIEGQ
jgi:hypothetical protein